MTLQGRRSEAARHMSAGAMLLGRREGEGGEPLVDLSGEKRETARGFGSSANNAP